LQSVAAYCGVLQCVAVPHSRSLHLNKIKNCPEIVRDPPPLTTLLQCVVGCCTSLGGAHKLQTPKHVCTAPSMHACLVPSISPIHLQDPTHLRREDDRQVLRHSWQVRDMRHRETYLRRQEHTHHTHLRRSDRDQDPYHLSLSLSRSLSLALSLPVNLCFFSVLLALTLSLSISLTLSRSLSLTNF